MKTCTWRTAFAAASVLPLLLLLSCGGGDIAGPGYGAVVNVLVTADPSTRFFMNETIQLHASFEDVEGRPVSGPPVTWKSVNSSYMQVSSTGVVTALRPGMMTIVANANGRLGEIRVEAFREEPPGGPSSFTAWAVSNTEIRMAWRSGRGLTESFEIERETVEPPQGTPGAEPGGFVNLKTQPDTSYGEISLPPKQTYRYRVRGCNRYGCSDYSDTWSVTTFATLQIETAEFPPGHVEENYSVPLEANDGVGEVTWSLAAGALPPGVSLNDAQLQGRPAKAGTFEFVIRASAGGQTAERSFSITVSDTPLPPVVGTSSLPEAVLGKAYSTFLHASRGDRSYAWAVTGGELPPGLTLAGNGISGIPTAVGAFPFTVEVTSAGMTAEAELVLQVGHPPVAVVLAPLAAGKRNDPYSETLLATGGDGVDYSWSVVSGQLPPGLTLGAGTGAITGTPTADGSYRFTVEVASGGRTATQGFYIDIISVDPLLIENWYLPVAIQGRSYAEGIIATGGADSNHAYRLIEGTLPPQFSLNPATGVISGTATSADAGTWFFTVEVQNGAQKVTRSLSLTVSSVGVEGFNIAIVNVSNMMPDYLFIRALNEAVAKWESIVTTDFPTFTMPGDLDSNFCQGHGHKLRAGDVIEDFVVLLGVYHLDGPLGVLGRAGPCGYVVGDPMMFRVGSFVMDEADVKTLTLDQQRAVAAHEIGHTLGIGTMWDFGGRTLITGKGGPEPQYTGTAGVAAYRALGGRNAFIAVENIGSPGTRDGHWRESSFESELMTGFIEAPGLAMPLSRMTVGSLVDLGYTVNADRADPYVVSWEGLAVAAEAQPEEEAIELHDDIVIEPFIRVLPGGSVRLERRR